jgi:GGDEF domain-containing protein
VTVALDAILVGVTEVRALLVDVPGEGIERELEEAGFVVSRTGSLSDGSLGDAVDVVLLRLTEQRPLETFSVARSAVDGAPIVVLTEPGRDADGQAAVRAGAEDHVSRDALAPGLLPRVLRYAVDQHRMRNELRELEITDELTGLPNLRGFVPVAEHRFRIADRDRVPVVLLFVRLDDLGDLSTEEGAIEGDQVAIEGDQVAIEGDQVAIEGDQVAIEGDQVAIEGDQVAIEAANVILDGVREADYPSRISSDTFCVLLTGRADGTEAIVLSRLVEALAVRNAQGDRARRLSLSIGSAVYDPDHPASILDIIETARRRMSEHRSDAEEADRSESP